MTKKEFQQRVDRATRILIREYGVRKDLASTLAYAVLRGVGTDAGKKEMAEEIEEREEKAAQVERTLEEREEYYGKDRDAEEKLHPDVCPVATDGWHTYLADGSGKCNRCGQPR